jgi:hypothetical protein
MRRWRCCTKASRSSRSSVVPSTKTPPRMMLKSTLARWCAAAIRSPDCWKPSARASSSSTPACWPHAPAGSRGRAAAAFQALRELERLHLRTRAVDDTCHSSPEAGTSASKRTRKAPRRPRVSVSAVDLAGAAEAFHLVRRQQRAGPRRAPGMPGHQGLERLLGLGAVPDLGVEREQAHATAGRGLVPLVGVGQELIVAAMRGSTPGGCRLSSPSSTCTRTGGEPAPGVPLRQARGAHQAQRRRAEPLGLERQPQAGVQLTKAQPRARQVLPHRALRGRRQRWREGLPQLRALRAGHADPGARAGVFPARWIRSTVS